MGENLHRVIGIDLGTTYSAVATFNKANEQTEVILNREDPVKPETTPSVVSLNPMLRKAIVGRAAKLNLLVCPQDTVIEIKREMGEVFTQETLDKHRAGGIFRPREPGFDGDPVKVRFSGEWRMPQEISAFILMKMKEVAEQEIGEEIRDAVITVPAYFTEKQKKATQEAALLAGLYPRQLIPEPTAAAICYGVDSMDPERKIYLVYDLGGGTFDVSIITVEEQKIEVIATSGDPRLGGGDFDDVITEWATAELRQNHNIDVSTDPSAKALIKFHAETTKIELSTFQSAKMPLLELRPQNPPVLELTREKFEDLIDALLNKSLSYVDTAIQRAEEKGVRREDVNAILLVGGSSRIPKVKTKLLDYFQKDETFVKVNLDPDAVVARGAAMLALKFAPSPPPFDMTKLPDNAQLNTMVEQELHLTHITEHSLGVGVQNNIFHKIINQGTNIPISISDDIFTNQGPSTHVEVRVYQGEGAYVYDNTLIGELELGPMEPQPQGTHKFDVTFTLDENGLLSMTVHHVNEGKRYQARFDQKTGIGGVEALAIVHNKLLQMYAAGAGTASPAGTTSPYPGSGVYPGQGSPQGAQYAAAGQAIPPPPVPAPPQPASPEPARAATQGQAQAPPAGAPQASGESAIIEPAREVPEQFRGTIRRAHKQLLKQPDPKLVAAFNAFTTAVNEGKPEDDLIDLGDELENVYHDCRRQTSE